MKKVEYIRMKIERIIAYGCSVTAGDELGDEKFFGPEIEDIKTKNKFNIPKVYGNKWEELKQYNRSVSWPNYIAKKINAECINRAQSGSNLGNIIFRLMDDYYSNKILDTDLILIGLPGPGRFFYFDDSWGSTPLEINCIFNFPQYWHHPELGESLLEFYVNDFNIMWEYYRDKHHLQLISDLLGNRVKIFSLLSIEKYWEDVFPKFSKKYPHFKNISYTNHLMPETSIYELCQNDILAWGHPPIKYHEQFAELAYSKLKEIGTIDVQDY